MKMTQKSLVLGSGFRVMTRKRPSWIIEDDYLFMYDSAAKPYNPESLLLYWYQKCLLFMILNVYESSKYFLDLYINEKQISNV